MNIALHHYGIVRVDVNEDNASAYYKHIGFIQSGRSETDDASNPFPIIHMTLRG